MDHSLDECVDVTAGNCFGRMLDAIAVISSDQLPLRHTGNDSFPRKEAD